MNDDLVGKTGIFTTSQEGMRVKVRIISVKNAYGNQRAVIEPLEGEGEVTVNLNKIELDNKGKPSNK